MEQIPNAKKPASDSQKFYRIKNKMPTLEEHRLMLQRELLKQKADSLERYLFKALPCKREDEGHIRAELVHGILSQCTADETRGLDFGKCYLLDCLKLGHFLTAQIILTHMAKHTIPLNESTLTHIASESITLTGVGYPFDQKTLILIRYYNHITKKLPALAQDKQSYYSRLPKELRDIVLLHVINTSEGKEVPKEFCVKQ
jgi:hypothetical protein